MAPAIEWPDFASIDNNLDQLVALSRYYGGDPDYVLAGGGNTSVKTDDHLYVKASGIGLAGIGPDGFVEMDRAALDALLGSSADTADEDAREAYFKEAVLAARLHPGKGQRPSVECVLHHLLPGRFVVHTHPALINMVTCAANGEALARELFGDAVLWIPYTTPGFVLAKTLHEILRGYTKRTGQRYPDAVVMGNHGLILCGDTPEEIRKISDRLCAAVRDKLGERTATPFGVVKPLPAEARPALVRVIAPALRALLAEDGALKVVAFDDSAPVIRFASGAHGKEAALAGPLCPDQIVYCKSVPLCFVPDAAEADAVMVERLRKGLEAYHTQHGFLPHVILVQGLGIFTAGDTAKSAETARELYLDSIDVMAGATQLGGIRVLDMEQRHFIENWEVEAYRRNVAAQGRTAGRMDGKVAVVTGAAQGFGREIAQELAAQGAHVVLADRNAEGACQAAEAIEGQHGPGRALAALVDVTDSASVKNLIDTVVRRYGGFDLFISNAGVVKPESVKTQSEADFDFVTQVNYKGYFLCVQQAAPILATQHLAKPDYWSDIIQINSKSGLEGSNRNGAYAGSKFGGIGLTQSFALELVEDGIKVNAICPGNFFDGPLWSDPGKGLFAQYLRTGKVAGAKSIADVRKSYEERVPMKRGCTTADVMKAVYYICEQRYETGQALPVTGGQTMLS